MKKSLFMMGMAALALASCTNEEVVNIPTSKAIGFDAFVGNTTKAPVTTIDEDELKAGDGFLVFGGYETLPTVFDNTPVKWNGASWAYSPLSYWKEGEFYKFAAYAPAVNVKPTFDYTTGTLTFTDILSNMQNQKDLIVAQIQNAIEAQATGNPEVKFNFRHALSMIKIKLTNGFRSGVQVQVMDGFKINGVKTKGKFVTTFGSAGTWSDVVAEEPAAVFTDGGATLKTNNEVYEPEFIVIPQTLAQKGDVTVSFSVTLTDEKGQPVAVVGGSGAGQNVKSFTIQIPDGQWDINNRYCYSATIDGKLFGLQEIVFGEPTVEPWVDYSNEDVTIQ